MSDGVGRHYREPGWFTTHVLNKLVSGLIKLGVNVKGCRVLEVRGRTSGALQQTPVNLLTIDGQDYLVSPRGEGQWVRNVRAASGELDLLIGRRRMHYSAVEVTDAHKAVILRSYLKRWKSEVGSFFDGVVPDSDDDAVNAIAHKHPVFALHQR